MLAFAYSPSTQAAEKHRNSIRGQILSSSLDGLEGKKKEIKKKNQGQE